MNIKHLEHLLALADTGSFSRAAEKLFITQSALSRSIQSLEGDLGAKVLDRIGKRNELTPLGLDVVARARHIVRDTAELRHSAQLLQQGGQGSVSVGLGSGPGALLTIPLMCSAAGHYPGMRVAITRGSTELQIQQLRSRQLDAMVVDMRRVTPATDLNIESLGEVRAGFIVNSAHPLAAKRAVSFQDITQYPVASTPLSDEVVRLLVDQYGVLANPSAMVTLLCEDVASLLATVARTQAIYLGVLATARAGLQDGSLVELPIKPKLQASARFAYVTLAGRTEAPVMAWFRQFVHEHLHD
ncbi:MAG TPA: LysR family transcriptional regulator [Burkholderiaceae bacterium]|jgi:DNA-binding transcriptional LysR family regulator|nr:LysR family transcriptional regulator [Rhodoferax sp.]MBK7548880.1 LysR family transcriptional regulator [Rhodoferax sp.]HNW01111.1 LysR family transcriptional regulator [Burkholderiaceae bacterium]HPW07168.1 LysR family transcriptional regulator [Burkholderiaceae bacterium]